jgi:hypothetical protein
MQKETFLYRFCLTSVLTGFLSVNAIFPQVFEKPYAEYQSHDDLIIVKIEINKNFTLVDLSVENKLDSGGWFCIGRNVVLKTSDNREYDMTRSENIPVCPDIYKFKFPGEVLNFCLFFPPVDPGKGPIDITEICEKACFFFKGVILDNKLNKDIRLFEAGLESYNNKNYQAGIENFKLIVADIPEKPAHVYGFSYYYLILSCLKLDQEEIAKQWFDELNKSNLPDKRSFINKLEEMKVF